MKHKVGIRFKVCIKYNYIGTYIKSFKYPQIICLKYNKITNIFVLCLGTYLISYKFQLKISIKKIKLWLYIFKIF